MRRTFLALAIGSLLAATPALAQQAPATAPAKPVATANPHIIMLRWFVGDLSRATKFYQSVFGMMSVQKMGDKVNVMVFPGGAMPGLILIEAPAENRLKGSFVIQVADVKATLAKAEAAGAKLMNTHFAEKVAGVPASSSHFTDPDGNVVEVMQMGGAAK